jgi:DNA (cytosine-5)-methyltransferase 1
VVAFVEQDKYCQKVLKKHWADVPIIDDIKEFRYDKAEAIDLLTGGFPCQPFSQAGLRRGTEDDRSLWGEMLRIIKESMPTWVIGENVAGIVNMELDNCISELESEGYETQAFIIPACAVSTPHRRDRVWIVAHACGKGLESLSSECRIYKKDDGNPPNMYCANSFIKGIYGLPNSERIRRNYGVSNRVDRLKALGNAIVPQCVMPIMWAIREIDGYEENRNGV